MPLVELEFTGRLDPASFAEFAEHRARRLSLGLVVHRAAAECFRASVSGEADLVDAFEMACSLGPIDCLVLDAFRRGQPRSSSVAALAVEISA